MKNNNKINPKGFVLWHGLLLIAVIAVISFIGGTVYTSNAKMKASNSEAAASDIQKAAELKAAQKKAAEEKQQPVEIPAEEKKVEPAPVPAPAPAPAPVKKTYLAPTAKKEPAYVGITAASQVGAETVVLTATMPATYSGTCKALVKHMDGSNHRWLENTFSSTNACTISVPRSTLTTASEWQYYLYFNSSDWTVKGDSGKHTFVL